MARRSINRRNLLMLGGTALCGVVMAPRLRAAAEDESGTGVESALAESDLIYLTPLHADGRESTCQAEVWFVADGSNAYVVTASDAWRARAVQNGLTRARVWVGDVGVWSRSDGAYRELPSLAADAALITNAEEHARVLGLFGDKYPMEWVIWGRRFRNGLADGSRVMLRYQPA